MSSEAQRYDLLPPEVGTSLLLLAAAVALLLWRLSQALPRPVERPLRGVPIFLFRTALGTVAIWLVTQILARFLVLATPWSLWNTALLGAFAFQAVAAFYRLEQSLLPPARGRFLLALRSGAVAVILLILLQPVLSRIQEREIEREVVVLIDDSESMHFIDERHSIGDLLAIASLFAPDDPALANRPGLDATAASLTRLLHDINRERAALDTPEGTPPDFLITLLERRREPLETLFQSASTGLESARSRIAETLDRNPRLPPATRDPLRSLADRLADPLPRYLRDAASHLESQNHLALTAQLDSAAGRLQEILQQLGPLLPALDDAFYRSLSSSSLRRVDELARRPRIDIARQALLHPGPEGVSLIDQLRDRYHVRFMSFGKSLIPIEGDAWLGDGGTDSDSDPDPDTDPGSAAASTLAIQRSATDLTLALEDILARIPPENLAGVLLLSDGRHNGSIPAEDAARQLGTQGSALGLVPLGSRVGPVDAAVVRLDAPESIYLGDRMALTAGLRMNGLAGKTVAVQLLGEDGAVLDSQDVAIPEAAFETEIRLVHTPEGKGIFDYSLHVQPIQGERFESNNTWNFKCAVTDDRTNVLLVDGFPRWEFRYLRNLFYGRDKSVHLQYVLLNPDRIAGQSELPPIPASASRAFGDAEATELPDSPEAWRGFDAIILGDLPPGAIDARTWRIIEDCVSSRGAMLVSIAGPRYMPHAFENDTFAQLLPITYTPGFVAALDSGSGFRLDLTAAGADSPILQQSLSRGQNEEIWDTLPSLPWRFRPASIKPGAEVLAFARPAPDPASPGGTALDPTLNPANVQAALEQLANQRATEQNEALLVTHRYGLGRVVMLNFDSTWRFRYGVGDTYHHRFWGQMLRWGTGENLRSGGDYVRLGTDQLSYTPLSPVRVTARLLDRNRAPITSGSVFVNVYKGERRLQRRPLEYRPGSNGIFETELPPFAVEGDYRLVLDGPSVEQAMSASGLTSVETELLVVSQTNAIEFAEITTDLDLIHQLAQLARGAVAPVDQAPTLLPLFGAARDTLEERRDLNLWDQWPLLALFAALVATEWLTRRASGLA